MGIVEWDKSELQTDLSRVYYLTPLSHSIFIGIG
nr:MAG TPA: hypothetical protein [Caudoviricetes sp.]